jgi:hypothetical protein
MQLRDKFHLDKKPSRQMPMTALGVAAFASLQEARRFWYPLKRGTFLPNKKKSYPKLKMLCSVDLTRQWAAPGYPPRIAGVADRDRARFEGRRSRRLGSWLRFMCGVPKTPVACGWRRQNVGSTEVAYYQFRSGIEKKLSHGNIEPEHMVT